MTTDCTEVLTHLWEYLDADLSTDEIAAYGRHFALCPPCRHAARYDRAFLNLLARQRRVTSPPEMDWRVKVVLRSAMH
ncbi:MAG: zf-HC2 domain-containing protein [Gemmatimonadales bacterium]|nr:zf-HC2 domain-containing protein [Gemmatimonadales bacterium]